MIRFLFKKSFYDFWDNLLRLAMVNLGFLLLAALPFLLSRLVGRSVLSSVFLLVLGVTMLCVYMAAVSLLVRCISDYGSFGLFDLKDALRQAWPAGLMLAAIVVVLTLVATMALPFYMAMGSFVGVFAGSMVFWILIALLLALQFYLPVRARIDKDPIKILKKCLIVSVDNPGLTLVSGLINTAVLVLSLFAAFLLPGPAAMLLLVDEALRLVMLKYEYLEAHPGANRRKIPWDDLLADDRERTGTRSLRTIVFPWKD